MEGFPTRERMIELYEEASGREVRDPHYWEVFGAMRFAAIMIPLADRMVDAGLMPAEINMAVANPVTQAMAVLLDIENLSDWLAALAGGAWACRPRARCARRERLRRRSWSRRCVGVLAALAKPR